MKSQMAEALLEISRLANSTLFPSTILQRVIDLATGCLGANFGVLHLLDETRYTMEAIASSGFKADEASIGVHPLLGEEALKERKVVRLADIGEGPAVVRFPIGHPPVGTVLGIPIFLEGKCVAELLVARSPGKPPFTTDDEVVAEIIGNMVAAALSTGRLFEELMEARRPLLSKVAAHFSGGS